MASEAERRPGTARERAPGRCEAAKAPPVLCEATLRAVWRRMVAEHLPAAAPRFGWPERTSAEFERVLLDQIAGEPCEAGGETCAIDLLLAIELADRALRGQVCLKTLAARSRALRSEATARPRASRPQAERAR